VQKWEHELKKRLRAQREKERYKALEEARKRLQEEEEHQKWLEDCRKKHE
jgi:hypothetical protein